MPRRIIFTCDTPNDQGGIIKNNVIDFTRFNKNPVVLKNHQWDSPPLGLMTDIKEENGYFTGIPIFHGITEDSKEYGQMFEKGFIRACSIGGEAIWKEDAAGRPLLNKEGLKECELFYLYEISIVTLPSNEDAVIPEAVKLYSKSDFQKISESIITLSSKINKMAEEKTTVEKEATEKATPTTTAAKNENKETLAAKEEDAKLPGWLQKITGESLASAILTRLAPAPENKPKEEAPSIEAVKVPQPKPIGLKAKAAEEAKSEMEACHEKAEKAVEKATEAKKKAEEEDADEEMKAAYSKAKKEADEAMEAYEKAKAAYESAKKDADEDEEEKAGKKSEKSTNSAMKPQRKSMEELKAAHVALAPKPENHTAKVVSLSNGLTFTKLSAASKKNPDSNEAKILQRVMTKDAGEKNIADYAVVLNSILNDQKYSAFAEKTRIMMNVNEAQIPQYRQNKEIRTGISLQALSAQLNAGYVEMWDKQSGAMKPITKLSSTDNALASPALNTIEWLPLAIFNLFPTTSWKNDIPIFPAQITGANTGIIWANIAADPTITRGTQPVNPSNYTYSDTAVALSLTPYWLQPMLWTPLTMHQLRYDQMGTGWAQAFAKWGAIMDDFLLYTLASTVPAGSVVLSSGISGYETAPRTFNIADANSPDAFYWGSFTGNLTSPSLNDIIRIEQIYRKQNFMLESEKAYLVTDPTMQAKLDSDPETKSLLTRWVNESGGDFAAFKHTVFAERSRVAIYDPATGQVKDPTGVIPATAISAGVGFIPSQVGIGLGMLDVFMVQDPTNYGYKMSADIRIGIVPLRANFNGTTLFTYAPGTV